MKVHVAFQCSSMLVYTVTKPTICFKPISKSFVFSHYIIDFFSFQKHNTIFYVNNIHNIPPCWNGSCKLVCTIEFENILTSSSVASPNTAFSFCNHNILFGFHSLFGLWKPFLGVWSWPCQPALDGLLHQPDSLPHCCHLCCGDWTMLKCPQPWPTNFAQRW